LGFDFIHPDDVRVIAGHLDEIASTPNATKTVEVRTRTKSKGWIWIEIRAANRLDDPSVEGIVLNYHDITERRDAVQRIAQSEKLLAEGQALSHLGSFTWDMRTDDLTWSDEQYRLLGLEPGSVEASFETLLNCIHPEDRDAFSSSTQASRETGAPFELDFRVVEANESVRWINGRGEVSVEDGVPIRLTGMSHDITDRRKAERERLLLLGQQKELATRLRMLLDSTGEGIYGLDAKGACTFMNKAGAALLGAEPDHFIGQDMHQLSHHTRADGSVYPSEDCPVYKVLATGLPVTGASEIIWRTNGTSFPVDYSAYPTGNDDGEQGVVVAFQDVTERERTTRETEKLEGQLLQAQKMEAVGKLAGGVAHDFNNILSVILNYAEFAIDGLDPNDTRLADIQEIIKAGEKAAKLVHQLLAFSREEIVEARTVDLNEVVIDVYRILSSSLGEDIDLVFKPLEGLPPVKADPGRIEQVLLNLAVNARDAMPSGGTLQLSTGTESVEIGGRSTLEAGDYVWITVGDSGIGMDEATLARAFDPFFTTKARGEGSGMGLSTAHGIIEQAGGCLFVDSELGVGTTFSIYLPRSQADVEVTIDEEAAEAVRGTETILLVEDEDAVRELVSRILEKQGYNVVPYASGLDALDYCRSNLEQIDLLLTDVVMPKISGKELSEQATSICEGLKTLFMSGYTDALIAQRGVPASGENLITKPFKPEKLLVALRGLLDTKVAS
jgi:two-component system, cell cycle sensor histidine kinase and response regulator CckA